jgi:prepilin-type N-terminal cleavage/methylation domain-containing protein
MLAFRYFKSAIRRRGSQLTPASPEAGLTLLECLAAIAVIGITASLITPPLFIAAATRVQNRRAEQALALAQGEVDRVQVLVETDQHFVSVLPGTVTLADLRDTPAPTTLNGDIDSINPAYNAYEDEPLNVNELRQIDTDGDGDADFLMQVFRSRGSFTAAETIATDPRPSEFELGVRVYSFQAEDQLGNLGRDEAPLTMTSGSGAQAVNPMAVLITSLSWSQESSAVCIYHGRDEQTCN